MGRGGKTSVTAATHLPATADAASSCTPAAPTAAAMTTPTMSRTPTNATRGQGEEQTDKNAFKRTIRSCHSQAPFEQEPTRTQTEQLSLLYSTVLVQEKPICQIIHLSVRFLRSRETELQDKFSICPAQPGELDVRTSLGGKFTTESLKSDPPSTKRTGEFTLPFRESLSHRAAVEQENRR